MCCKKIEYQKAFLVAALVLFSISPNARAGLFEESVSGETSTSTEVTEEQGEEAYSSGETSDEESSDEESSDEESAEPTVVERIIEKSGLSFDLNGHIRGDLFVGKMPDYGRGEIKSGYGELALKFLASKGKYGNAFADLRFQAGYMADEHYLGQPSDHPNQGADIGEFHTRLKLREAYVNAYIGPLDIRFGKQIIVWGRADGINPTNNLTPIDLRGRSPEEDDRRIGNLALRANLNFSPVRIEGVWVPMYSPSYIPVIAVPGPVRFADPDYPSRDIAKGTVAGKFHLLFPAFEASFSYLYGYGLQPGLSYDSDDFSEAGNFVYVKRTAFEQHVAGFDFSTSIAGKVGLRGEVAFRYPVDYEDLIYAPNPDLNYVLGLDKEFGPVMIIAQYVGRYVFGKMEAPYSYIIDFVGTDINLDNLAEQSPTMLNGLPDHQVVEVANKELYNINQLIHGQKESIQHGVSARIEWKTLHDTLSLSLFGMVNISTLEWVLYPKLLYNITDAMTLAVGGEIYMGPEDTLFNYIEEVLSAGYTELKISF
jgi:hypothetical protein